MRDFSTEKRYLLELALLCGAILMLTLDFLSFHTTIELQSVLVAGYACLRSVKYRCEKPSFYVVLGATLLSVALIDLCHLLSYHGMGVFSIDEANVATQLWVLGRYIFVTGLLTAILMNEKTLDYRGALGISLAITVPAIAAIYRGHFPDAYLPEMGLTNFKVVSEYLIIGLLLLSMLLLNGKQDIFSFRGHLILLGAIGITVLSELMFTLYQETDDIFNAIGHILKLVAYLAIFNLFVSEENKRLKS